jgi:hypothetical protein
MLLAFYATQTRAGPTTGGIMKTPNLQPALLLLLLVSAVPFAACAAPLRTAVFPFVFDDTSLQPPQPAELTRLRKIDAQLRQQLAQSGRYTIVSIGPVAAQSQRQRLDSCQACAVSLAHQLGAQVAVIGWVQKVSNLILNINAVIRSVPAGKVIASGSVSIRGNTDQSWSQGLRSLVADQLLATASPSGDPH